MMKKVICIHVDRTNDHGLPNLPHPELGETVSVVETVERYNQLFYSLAGYELFNGLPVRYNSKNFAETSDLDETTLVNEEYEEKYCVPVNK